MKAELNDQEHDEGSALSNQLLRLWENKWLVVVGLVVGLVGGFAASSTIGPTYTSSADVLIRSTSLQPFESADATRRVSVQTEIEVAESEKVAAIVREELRPNAALSDLRSGLRVTNPPETAVLRFNYTSDTPLDAAELANAFAAAYLEDREARTQGIVNRITESLQIELEALDDRRESLDTRIADAEGEERASERAALEAEHGLVLSEILEIRTRLVEVRTLDTTPGDVVRTAAPVSEADGPGLVTWLAVGGFVGLGLGLVLAQVASLFGARARTRTDISSSLGAPVLATVPSAGNRPKDPLLGTTPESQRAREAYRSLALALTYGRNVEKVHCILIIEPRRSGVANHAAVKVAADLAEMGRVVVLVEADLRNPDLATRLPIVDHTAAADHVEEPWKASPSFEVSAPNPYFLFPGRPVSEVAETLTSPKVEKFFADVKGLADFVIVVVPPLLDAADGLALTHLVDGVIVVSDARTVRKGDLVAVRELVLGTGGTLLGAVLVGR